MSIEIQLKKVFEDCATFLPTNIFWSTKTIMRPRNGIALARHIFVHIFLRYQKIKIVG